jgi:transposase
MSSVTSATGTIHLGMDTSKNTIVVGILMPGDEVPVIDRIWNEEGSVRAPGRPARRPGRAAGLL